MDAFATTSNRGLDPSGLGAATVHTTMIHTGIKEVRTVANALITASVLTILVNTFGVWATHKDSKTLLSIVRPFRPYLNRNFCHPKIKTQTNTATFVSTNARQICHH